MAVTRIIFSRIAHVCPNGSGPSISSLGLSVGSNRFLILINPSNYNGSAALHVLTNLRRIGGNHVLVNNGSIAAVRPGSHSVTVIFRGCTLCPRVAITSGVNFTLGVTNAPGSRVHGHIRGTTRVLSLARCLSHGPGTLSNKRHRHITVNHTVIHRPGIFLVSRPLSGLSTGLHIRAHARVTTLRHRLNIAALCIARSRARTLAVNSHVTIVGLNVLRRINTPARLCSHPTGIFITNFVNSPSVGLGARPIIGNGTGVNRSAISLPTRTIGGLATRSGNRVIINFHPRSTNLTPISSPGTFSLGIIGIRSLNSSNCVCNAVIASKSTTRTSRIVSSRGGLAAVHIGPHTLPGINTAIGVGVSPTGVRLFTPSARLHLG